MQRLPSPLLRRALALDILLCVVCLGLSAGPGSQLLTVFWRATALVCVLDALVVSHLLGARGE
ncbi:MAG: hypothetical protein ACOYMY_06610 [Prochlorococcaceae cyanobacterium]|jgi:hypothetical protein